VIDKSYMFLIRRDYYKEKQKIGNWEYNVIDLYPITALKSDFIYELYFYWISVLVPSG
jgi:hypothetical protein